MGYANRIWVGGLPLLLGFWQKPEIFYRQELPVERPGTADSGGLKRAD
jgi:hypothetical protein